MIVDLDRLAEGGERFAGDVSPHVLDLEGDPDVKVRGPLHYRIHVLRVSDELIVRGTLDIEAAFRCSRCGEFFDLRVEDASFERVRDLVEQPPIRNRDGTESVDLTPDLREAILLAFPAYPVCKADCKGLCPRCGMNWNAGTCECEAPPDARWDALEGLDV